MKPIIRITQSMQRMLVVALMGGFLVLSAQDDGQAKDVIGPCAGDIEKYCSTTPRTEVAACLNAHSDMLSPECRTHRLWGYSEGRPSKSRGIEEICARDISVLCMDLPREKLAECLRAHRNELSTECRRNLASRQRAGAKGDACQEDSEKFCKDIPADQRRQCLLGHLSELSPACRRAIQRQSRRQ